MPNDKRIAKSKILKVIRDIMVHEGVPPTVEELRRALRVGSTRTVLRYLRWLEDEGDIERWPGARGIRLLRIPGRGTETRPIPVLGEAPAGSPALAEGIHEGWLRLPVAVVNPGSNFFLLRVRGDSMNRAIVQGDRIESGDLVLVRQQPDAEPGAIVVALIDGEATIKRLARGPDYFMLKPESSNSKHQPILVQEDFEIQGVVTRIIRKGAELLDEHGGFGDDTNEN